VPMSRRTRAALVTLALLAAVVLSGCARTVRVESGELVTCAYGEVVTNTVKVVEVPADKAAQYRVVSTTVTCDKHKGLEALYAQAQASIVASDLVAARLKLAEIVKADAAFRRAQAQIDAIDAGQKPSPDSGTGGDNTGGKEPVGPIANLASRVPDTLPGYTAAPVISDVFTLSRQYKPAAGTPTDSLVVVVEQFRDAAAAKAALARNVSRGYGDDVSTVKIAGRSVRFGTDGRRFATLAWYEQGVLIVMEATSPSGKPESLKSHMVSLASEIVK